MCSSGCRRWKGVHGARFPLGDTGTGGGTLIVGYTFTAGGEMFTTGGDTFTTGAAGEKFTIGGAGGRWNARYVAQVPLPVAKAITSVRSIVARVCHLAVRTYASIALTARSPLAKRSSAVAPTSVSSSAGTSLRCASAAAFALSAANWYRRYALSSLDGCCNTREYLPALHHAGADRTVASSQTTHRPTPSQEGRSGLLLGPQRPLKIRGSGAEQGRTSKPRPGRTRLESHYAPDVGLRRFRAESPGRSVRLRGDLANKPSLIYRSRDPRRNELQHHHHESPHMVRRQFRDCRRRSVPRGLLRVQLLPVTPLPQLPRSPRCVGTDRPRSGAPRPSGMPSRWRSGRTSWRSSPVPPSAWPLRSPTPTPRQNPPQPFC